MWTNTHLYFGVQTIAAGILSLPGLVQWFSWHHPTNQGRPAGIPAYYSVVEEIVRDFVGGF